MHPETAAPAFEEFLRFVASRCRPSPRGASPTQQVLAAAREAHEQLSAMTAADDPVFARGLPGTRFEVLALLAASSEGSARPPELLTVHGFRVRLAYRDGTESQPSSICVLVQCPERWIERVQGRVAYLWSGATRFELGEFDADGKAIGTLPAGIEITMSDLASGRIRLEAPEVPSHE